VGLSKSSYPGVPRSLHFTHACVLWYQQIMSKSIRGTKKSRGRPRTTGAGEQIGMRWQRALLQAIDAWRRAQADEPTRAEAIRRLVRLGLNRNGPVPRQRR
jgi:hypothetical protein